jgi:hypothetical protein
MFVAGNVAQPGGGEVQGRLAVGECPDHTRTSPDLATARLLRERTPPCVTRAMYPASAIMRGAPRVSAGKRPADHTPLRGAGRACAPGLGGAEQEPTKGMDSLRLFFEPTLRTALQTDGGQTWQRHHRRRRSTARLRAHATVGCKCADRKHPLWQLSSPEVVKARDA